MTQGERPDVVFDDLYPILYAAETLVGGAYARMSDYAATFADSYGGIKDKVVLDIGCGYGTTTMAIAAFSPKKIVAVDSSPQMIELLKQLLFSDDDIESWLHKKGAKDLLGNFWECTVMHFKWMRAAFRNGLFRRRGGSIIPIIQDGLVLDVAEIGSVDTVIGNNYFHWPVKQRLAQLRAEKIDTESDRLLARACRDALHPLAALMPRDGLAVLMEPKDFVTIKEDAAHDADLERNTLVMHPIYRRFHQVLNALLMEEYNIDRRMPTTEPLFNIGEFHTLARDGGFALQKIHHVEWTYAGDPVDTCFVRLPLVFGSINLPFKNKLKLGEQVRRELEKLATKEELRTPVRFQWFFIILRKI